MNLGTSIYSALILHPSVLHVHQREVHHRQSRSFNTVQFKACAWPNSITVLTNINDGQQSYFMYHLKKRQSTYIRSGS